MNSCADPAISVPHILGLTIRWLSGSSFHDIRDAGIFLNQLFFDCFGKEFQQLPDVKDLR